MAKQIKRAWFTEIVSGDIKLAIVENTPRTVDGVTDQWSAISQSLTVKYEVILSHQDLVADSTMSLSYVDIPSRYHRTIIHKAIAMGYQDPRSMDLERSQYFDQLYQRDTKKAKRFTKGQMVTDGRIIPQDF
jgi:hypothetical protein